MALAGISLKKTKVLSHAMKNICFNHIMQYIVKPDTQQETSIFLANAIILQRHEHQRKNSSYKSIPGPVSSLPLQCMEELNHGKKWHRIARDGRGHNSSCLLPLLSYLCSLHIPVHQPADQVLRKKHCQEQQEAKEKSLY